MSHCDGCDIKDHLTLSMHGEYLCVVCQARREVTNLCSELDLDIDYYALDHVAA